MLTLPHPLPHPISRPPPQPRSRPHGRARRQNVTALALAAMVMTSGCMTHVFMATDYKDRTEKQWWTAFGADVAVGGALIGSSFALDRDGGARWWMLAGGMLSAMYALWVLPRLDHPSPPPPVRRRQKAAGGRAAEPTTRRPGTNGKPARRTGGGEPSGRKTRSQDEAR